MKIELDAAAQHYFGAPKLKVVNETMVTRDLRTLEVYDVGPWSGYEDVESRTLCFRMKEYDPYATMADNAISTMPEFPITSGVDYGDESQFWKDVSGILAILLAIFIALTVLGAWL